MKRTLFSLMLLFGLMAPATVAVAAQPASTDQVYTSEITGDEIDLGASGQITWIEDNFDLRETDSFQEEYIWFTYGWSNFQIVLIDGPNEAPVYHETTFGNMEAFYDEWELIDEGITDDHTWFLGEAELSGSPLIVYYEFELDAFGDVDMAFLQFTDVSMLQQDLEMVQSEVTIGGDPILPNTDAAELEALAGLDVGSPDSSPESDDDNAGTDRTSRTSRSGTETEEEDEESTTSRTSRGGTDSTTEPEEDEEGDEGTSRTSRTGTNTTETEEDEDNGSTTSRTSRGGSSSTEGEGEGNTSETSGESGDDRESRGGRLSTNLTGDTEEDDGDDTSTPVSGADWSEMGLLSDTEWESPTYGNLVSWDASTWEFAADYEYAIVVSEDPPYDIITLQTTDGLGYVYLTVDIAYESTPTSLIDYWTSEEYDAQITNGVTVLETGTTANSATLVYETTNSIDQPLIVVLEATFLDDGQVIFSQISAAPDTIHEVYEQYLDGVEVDGVPFEMTFTVEDIQDITGN